MSEERGYSGSAVALGFILGGVIGAGVAMLFAPESAAGPRAPAGLARHARQDH